MSSLCNRCQPDRRCRQHPDPVQERHDESVQAARRSIRKDPKGWVKAARTVFWTLGVFQKEDR